MILCRSQNIDDFPTTKSQEWFVCVHRIMLTIWHRNSLRQFIRLDSGIVYVKIHQYTNHIERTTIVLEASGFNSFFAMNECLLHYLKKISITYKNLLNFIIFKHDFEFN